MKPLLDKVTEQQCPQHSSPYGFFYKEDGVTNESRLMCDKCINPQIDITKLIKIKQAYKFLEEQKIYEDQRRLQITSLWQQFKHYSEIILGTLRDLQALMEHLLIQLSGTLNDEFSNRLTTQSDIESLGLYLESMIHQDNNRHFAQEQKQQVPQQQEQYCVLQCNNILEEQRKQNAELRCFMGQIWKSVEYNNFLSEDNKNSADIANYSYQTKQTINVEDYCNCICLSYNETQLIAGVSKSIHFYSISQQGQWIKDQFSLEGHTRQIGKVKFNHNSTLIASCDKDYCIILWSKHLNGQWGILEKLSGPRQDVWSICFNHDSSLLASGRDIGTIQIHNFNNGQWKLQQSLTRHTRFVQDVCFNNNSTKLASGSADMLIIIWELNNQGQWTVFQTLKEHILNVSSVQFNSESNQLISSSCDQTIKIWVVDNDEKWKLQHSLTGHREIVMNAQFNKQSNMIVSGSFDKLIKLWKINKEGKWKCTQTIDQHQKQVNNVIINSDSSMILSCSLDKQIKIHKRK